MQRTFLFLIFAVLTGYLNADTNPSEVDSTFAPSKLDTIYHEIDSLISSRDFVDVPRLLDLAAEHLPKHPSPDEQLEFYDCIAKYYFFTFQNDSAQKYLDLRCQLAEELGDTILIVKALRTKASLQTRSGNLNIALEFYRDMLMLSEKIDYSRGRSIAYEGIAGIHQRTQTLDSAMVNYQNALDFVDEDDYDTQMRVYSGIASIYLVQSMNFEAKSNYLKAIDIAEKTGNFSAKTRYLGNIGLLAAKEGRIDESIETMKECLALSEDIGDIQAYAAFSNRLGVIYLNMNNINDGYFYTSKAYEIAKKIGDMSTLAMATKDLSRAFYLQKNFENAIKYAKEAEEIASSSSDPVGLHESYALQGMIYTDMRDWDMALHQFEKDLELLKQYNAVNLLPNLYLNRGGLFASMGKHEEALTDFDLALELGNQITDYDVSPIYGNIGGVYNNIKRHEEAFEYFKDAHDYSVETDDYQKQVTWALNLAISGAFFKDYEEVDSLFKHVLYLHRLHKIERHLVETYDAYADFLKVYGELDSSLAYYDLAIEQGNKLSESIGSSESRTKFSSVLYKSRNTATRVAFVQFSHTGDKSYLDRAFSYVEGARSNVLLDQLAEAKGNLREGVPDSLLEKERLLMNRVGWLNDKLAEVRSDNIADTSVVAELENELLEKENQLDRLKSSIVKTSPRYADLQYPKPLSREQVQQELLDEGSALIEFLTNDSISYMYCVTQDSFAAWQLPGNVDVAPVVDVLRNIVASPEGNYPNFASASMALYNNCLKPAEDLIADKEVLIISGHGPFNRIPFEVLLTDSSGSSFTDAPYLVREKTIHYTPSATVLYQNRVNPKKYDGERKDFAGFGDPIYELEREGKDTTGISSEQLVLRSATGDSTRLGFQRLPHTAEELQGIAGLFDDSEIWLRDNATETNVKEADLSPYKYVHFACHGVLNENKPSYSGLMLTADSTENGFLQMYEIYNLDLNADLVTLSACHSGIGKEISGEGMIGLSRAFMYAGTPSLLVSLWPINDRSTADFMAEFYGNLQDKGRAESLRETQLSFIDSPEYSHPFYWAPFVMVGER